MTKNLTLRIDATMLRDARQFAVSQDLSLSQWVSQLIARTIHRQTDFQRAKRRAIKRLHRGLPLGGKPLSRATLYDR